MKQPKSPKKRSLWQRSRRLWIRIWNSHYTDDEHLLFSAFIIVLLAIVVVNTIYVVSRHYTEAGNARQVTDVVSKPQKVLTSQQTAVSPAYRISVGHVTENATFDPAFSIPDDQTMLMLKLSITNTSRGVQSFIPSQQLYIRSIDGDYAQLHASMYAAKPIPSGNIKPGQTVSGDISFSVSKRQARPLLYVDLGWNNYGPVVFDVLH